MTSIIPITKSDLPSLLPKRAKNAHKQAGGKSLIIAGSLGMWGAAYLCGLACYRVGAGYVYLSDNTPNLTEHPDFLSVGVSEKMSLENFSAIAIGPGLNITSKTKNIFLHIKRKFKNPVVVDAGALDLITDLTENWIITPHEGELARLLKTSADEIRRDRFKAVRLAQEKFGGIIVLKGKNTLIANNNNTYEIKTGNKALAKAGTGDVLAGIITGFLSQGLKPINAAVLACGLHGYIADRWAKDKDYLSLMASDLIEEIPRALFRLRTL